MQVGSKKASHKASRCLKGLVGLALTPRLLNLRLNDPVQSKLFCLLCVLLALASWPAAKDLSHAKRCIKLIDRYERTYSIPQGTLQSIALVETGTVCKGHKSRVPWPWAVNVDGIGRWFENKRSAKAFVRSCLKQGARNIDVGCMQISIRHHPEAFSSLNQALDPKSNIRYAAELLQANYKRLKSWKAAVQHYHSAKSLKGIAYYARFQKAKAGIERSRTCSVRYLTSKHFLHNKSSEARLPGQARRPGIVSRIFARLLNRTEIAGCKR